MDDIRWKQRFENYQKVLNRLQEALAVLAGSPQNHLYEMATIQAFEFCIELGWKLLKDYLKHQGVKDVSLPRDVIKQAFHFEIVTDGQTWIEMLEARNKTSHTYDDAQAAQVVAQIGQVFYPALLQVKTYCAERL